jgi:hypothetical protein
MTVPLYRAIAQGLAALENSIEHSNTEWVSRWNAVLREYDKLLPSGSGFDNGSVLVKADSNDERLVIETSFHHMNDNGYYDGWTEHRLTVKPNLSSVISIAVGGRNRRDIKDYIAEVFTEALLAEVDEQVMMNKVLVAEGQKAKSA